MVGVDGGAAERAPRGALEPGQRAGPVEAVAAGEVREHVAGAELVEADGALGLLRRVPPRPPPPHQPPHHALLRVHLALHAQHRRAALAAAGSAQLYAPRAVVPAATSNLPWSVTCPPVRAPAVQLRSAGEQSIISRGEKKNVRSLIAPLDDGLPLVPELLVQPLLGLPGIAVQRPLVYHLHHPATLLLHTNSHPS